MDSSVAILNFLYEQKQDFHMVLIVWGHISCYLKQLVDEETIAEKKFRSFQKHGLFKKKKHKKRIKRENRILEVVQKYQDIITLDNIQQYLGELVKASKHKL